MGILGILFWIVVWAAFVLFVAQFIGFGAGNEDDHE